MGMTVVEGRSVVVVAVVYRPDLVEYQMKILQRSPPPARKNLFISKIKIHLNDVEKLLLQVDASCRSLLRLRLNSGNSHQVRIV